MSSPGFFLDLRLFLEGIEVPVVGATVTTQIGSAATANIQVVPDDTLLELLPRTVVHLFVLDSPEFHSGGTSGKAPSSNHYKLLFCGEVTGVQFSKAGAGNRSASLNCMDFSNVWDTNYAFSLNFGTKNPENITIKDRATFLAISQPSFDNIVNTPATTVRLIAQQRPQTAGLQGSESVLGGLFSVIESLSGVQGVYMGAGPWPTVHERRTRVLDSIVSDSGETAAKLYSAATFANWLKGRQGEVGAVSSFRDTVNMILGFILYSFVPNPAPKYIIGKDATGEFPGRDTPLTAKLALRETLLSEFSAKEGVSLNPAKLINLDLEFLERILEALRRLKAREGEPLKYMEVEDTGYKFAFRIHDGWREAGEPKSAHERGFAIDIGHPQFSGRMFAGRMPFKVNGESLTEKDATGVQGKFRWIMYSRKIAGSPVSTLEGLKVAAAHEDFKDLWSSSETIDDAITLLKALSAWNAIVTQETTGVDGILQHGGNMRDWTKSYDPLFELVLVHNDPVHIQDRQYRTKYQAGAGSLSVEATDSAARERLNSFIFRPDIWFAAPPQCNVIYPDQVTSFSMQRVMLRETTRLQLNIAFDQIKEQTEQLDRLSYAPKLVGEEALQQQGAGRADKIIIHDHEVYSGVIPKFERASDILYYRLRGEEETITSDVEERFASFADRLAHFHLLSNRYQARTASVSSVFNLNVVCGFPGVVIDAPLSEYELAQAERGARSPRVHWLGMISSVSHSITQGGAQTNVAFTHVRSHKTGDKTDDLFGEHIDEDGFLTVQNDVTVSRDKGVFPVEAPTSIAVLNGVQNSPLHIGLPLDEDETQLYFWEALGQLVEGNLLYYANKLPDFDTATLDKAALTQLKNTDRSELAASGQVIAIPEVKVPGGKTTKGVIWDGAPVTILIRLKGTVTHSPGAFGNLKYAGFIETAPALQSQLMSGATLVQLIKAKKTALVWDSLTAPTFAEFLITLPGSMLFVEEVGTEGDKKLPVEEALRPSWISSDYSTEEGENQLTKISENVYLPFFDSPCIVDRVLTKDPPEGLARNSVEQAVDHLVAEYSHAVSLGPRNVLAHIHGVTHRPVATLPQVLAPKNYILKPGNSWSKESLPSNWSSDEKYAMYGGFHSNAVNFGQSGYGSGLEFLTLKGVPLQSRYGQRDEDLSGQITDHLDPRAERSRRVEQYRGQIKGAVAIKHPASMSLSTSDVGATLQTNTRGIAKRG